MDAGQTVGKEARANRRFTAAELRAVAGRLNAEERSEHLELADPGRPKARARTIAVLAVAIAGLAFGGWALSQQISGIGESPLRERAGSGFLEVGSARPVGLREPHSSREIPEMRTKSITIGAVAGVVAVSSVQLAIATDRLVPQQYPTIQAAVDAASVGDTVSVAVGVYVESVNLRGKAIEVRSVVLGGATVAAPEGTRSFVAVSGEPAATKVIGFRMARQGNTGGGVETSGASLTFEACAMVSCANVGGGGARITGGAVHFINCHFGYCIATGSGGTYGGTGGAYVSGGTTLFDGCAFEQCDGGPSQTDALLHVNGGAVTLRTTTVTGGNPSVSWGQIYNASGSLLAEDCVFEDSTKPALFGWSPWTVRRCTFRNFIGNAVMERRGGTHVVDACEFTNCHSTGPLLKAVYSGVYVIGDSTFCDISWVGEMFQGGWTDAGGNVFDELCPCAGDISGNGAVDGIDLSVLLGLWGTDGTGGKFPADITDDGVVDGADLAAVLGGWGPCP